MSSSDVNSSLPVTGGGHDFATRSTVCRYCGLTPLEAREQFYVSRILCQMVRDPSTITGEEFGKLSKQVAECRAELHRISGGNGMYEWICKGILFGLVWTGMLVYLTTLNVPMFAYKLIVLIAIPLSGMQVFIDKETANRFFYALFIFIGLCCIGIIIQILS